MAEGKTAKKNVFKNFFKSLTTEFRKLSWPNKSQLTKQTIAVVVVSIVLSAFIRLIDVIAQYIIGIVSAI